MVWNSQVKKTYEDTKAQLYISGGTERLAREHEKGKLTARERMAMLFDNKVYSEINMLVKSRTSLEDLHKKTYLGDGVIACYGKINGITAYAVAQDCTISGGAGGEAHVQKICQTLELALKTKSPFICLCDSGGAKIEEGIISLSAYSKLFYLNTQASGYIPQIAAIMGNCAGGSSYSPAMCDYIFMVKNTSQFFITGPRVIKELTGEVITMEDLGGSEVHSQYSGVANFVCENDAECIQEIKKLLNYTCIKEKPFKITIRNNYKELGRKIEEIVTENARHSYDVRQVISCLVDEESFFEISSNFGRNIVIGFCRLDGKTTGIVANQPCVLGGAIDCDASDKCARFVRFCDSFEIPLLIMIDVPGFYPGAAEEKKGILRHGSKMLYAFSEATIPKISLIMRKAYGGAYCAMNSKASGADMVYAWPICEIAVMGAEGAVDVMYNKQIKQAENPTEFRQEKIDSYKEKYLNPYFAASLGMVDEVILPEETREKIIQAFDALKNKEIKVYSKKHGNIPL
ncbi:acyl-CoA carboxylase subunit beta [Parablautia muri]|uniref:Acyl-CoA carboxylase subunit beta n=1 Tax=Parablautia muri TaxID=2320879 RepID=A0A9X5BCA4_9FIRM|nr:acyl-CoA carboxylase subunit beta [Parablautia muri]NBJ91366.1 acyl-CoA carboxylase subunit beta [Parablautia muri]